MPRHDRLRLWLGVLVALCYLGALAALAWGVEPRDVAALLVVALGALGLRDLRGPPAPPASGLDSRR